MGGLHCAIGAAIVGILYTVSRFIFAEGYTKGGPRGRVIGSLMMDVELLVQLYFSVRAALEIEDIRYKIIVGGIVLVAFMCLLVGFIIGGGK